MRGVNIAVAVLITLLFTTSCDREMVFDEFQKIENRSWRWEEPVEFSFSMDDTATYHNILVQLRHTSDYPLSNLYMFVHVEGPSGQTMTDTINFILAENSGKWIGKGVGNLLSLGYVYKKNTLFPDSGEYRISIEQAMRLPEVPVAEVGLRIEKYNP